MIQALPFMKVFLRCNTLLGGKKLTVCFEVVRW